MNKQLQTVKYLFADYMAAVLVWLLLFWFRKQFVDTALIDYQIPIEKDQKLIVGLMMIPLFWVIFYYFSGFYRNIYRRSRLTELKNTFYTSFAGSLFIFFAVLLDDSVADYKGYYYTFSVLFILQLVITYIFRFILSSRTNKRIQNREIGFNTVIVGSNEKAYKLYRELEDSKISNGFFFKGFVNVNGEDNSGLKQHLPHLGSYKNLKDIIHEYSIEEVVIALETTEHDKLNDVFAKLENEKVFLKIIPDLYSIFTRMVKMNNILGAVLIEVDFEVMPEWQKNFKRIFDIMFSIFILLVLSPFLLLIAMAVKLSGKGPVFYTQERIGILGKPFRIIKFRSMKVDAETAGPQLSKENDPRITSVGKFLRKTRLDEFPQFFNVLKGDMSVVGPRPERQHFINQIVLRAPHYTRLQKVRPGITSWGQVKYGYAENVDQMVERLYYDILYIENISIGLDMKILIYTVLIMLQGRGK